MRLLIGLALLLVACTAGHAHVLRLCLDSSDSMYRDRYCLRLNSRRTNWKGAKTGCRQYGGELFYPQDDDDIANAYSEME